VSPPDFIAGPLGDPLFLGREEEIRQVVTNLRLGRHTLVLGERGMGKTAVVVRALSILEGEEETASPPDLFAETARRRGRTITVLRAVPLGDCLKEIAEQLWHGKELLLPQPLADVRDWDAIRKWLTGRGSAGQQAVVCESLRAVPGTCRVVFRTLDRISPGHQTFLESMLLVAVVCAEAARPRENYCFKRIWSSFTRVELKALPDAICRQMIITLMDQYGIQVADKELYVREVLKSANGNPFQIRNILWHGARQRRLGHQEIRSLRRTEEGEYFNMGPIYIFGASVFTLFKIFSLGMDNREFYIYFSALGFLVYLTFRVFRNFFLFRPQKWGK
jgi:hypothetical protein